MRRILWAMVILAGAAAGAARADPTVTRIKVQELTETEERDTTLERGELVAVYDEAEDDTAAVLRVGDGERAGGRLAVDPAAVRATRTRLLRSDEYALIPAGLATYSNNVWQLLPAREHATGDYGRTGCVQVASMYPIAAVSYCVAVQSNATFATTPATMDADTTNAWITASEQEAILTGDVLFPFEAAISNITVYAWTQPQLIGSTADLRRATTLVRSGTGTRSWADLDAAEALNKETFEAQMDGRWGDDWWRYVAGGAVRLGEEPLWMSATMRQEGSEEGLEWVYRTAMQTDRTILSAVFASGSATNQAFAILACDLTGATVQIWIETRVDFVSEPVIQHRTSLLTGAWTNCVTTTDWPKTETITIDEQSRTAWLLECANPAEGFFRVTGETSESAAVSDYIEFAVGDLRNTGTITAGQGFRAASPFGGTNYVSGLTTNLTVDGANLTFIGGILTGIE